MTALCSGALPPTHSPLGRLVWILSKMHKILFLSRGGFAAKCTIFRILMCSVENGLEMKLWAFSICRAARNDLAPKLDVSALFATVFLPLNAVSFPGLKISWQPSCTHLYPRMTCLVAAADGCDISRHSSEPLTLPEVTPLWQLENKLLSIWKQTVVHNCLPDSPPRSRKIE